MSELPENVDPVTNYLLDAEGQPVIDDSTGQPVVWSEGMPTGEHWYKFATSPTFDTTWKFEVTGATVTVPVMQTVLTTDENGDPIYENVVAVDENGVPVLDSEGNLTFTQGAQLTHEAPVLDENGQITLTTEVRDLVYFVRKPGITAEDAWNAFHIATSDQYPDAIQTAYTPTLLQLSLDWNAGNGTIFYV